MAGPLHLLDKFTPHVWYIDRQDTLLTAHQHPDVSSKSLRRKRGPVLFQRWSNVCDVGPALKRHWPVKLTRGIEASHNINRFFRAEQIRRTGPFNFCRASGQAEEVYVHIRCASAQPPGSLPLAGAFNSRVLYQ